MEEAQPQTLQIADGAAAQIDDVRALKDFHAIHFRGQPVPNVQPSVATYDSAQPFKALPTTEDDLGYYEDGVKRTLTDDQIAMFRYSEVQRLLAVRHRAQKEQEEKLERQAKRDKRNREERKHVKKRTVFDDEPQEGANVVLSYDGALDQNINTNNKRKVFLWPQLPA